MGADPGAEPLSTRPAAIDSTNAERQLVAAILRRDRKAGAELVSAHADAVYAYVRLRLSPRRDRVDDVVQDVFVAALGHLEGFRGDSPLRAWLIGIARHKVEDFYRQQLRQPDALDESGESLEPADDGPPLDERIDRARAIEKTQRLLARMPPSYGVVLLWRYWEGRSLREIADATGRTAKAIERLLARARARFRELWDEEEP